MKVVYKKPADWTNEEIAGFWDWQSKNVSRQYQYFTEAMVGKLRASGYLDQFYTLEEGVKDYVENYLIPEGYL